jgi:Flp pilus assembly CpaF family ATPase
LEKLALLLGMAAGLEGPVAANLISQAIDIVVHLHFDRRSGKRLVTEIREITGYEGSKILTNAIFTRGKDGQLRPTGTMSDRLRERLADVGYDTRRLTIGTAA